MNKPADARAPSERSQKLSLEMSANGSKADIGACPRDIRFTPRGNADNNRRRAIDHQTRI
jgi:hypothetical protein